jgi:hypothetical protein
MCIAFGDDDIEALANLGRVRRAYLRSVIRSGRELPKPNPDAPPDVVWGAAVEQSGAATGVMPKVPAGARWKATPKNDYEAVFEPAAVLA